ncbi:hypothetical protein [Amycolatopsis sp.]|jgi:cytochrome P450|uniref:hypothetical protein n=1 Tax=Amycolatopsis sp. TaxID=37632 RepID=UPI002DFC192C|nr:hypothetical protein [Amycolatopsis sp.]
MSDPVASRPPSGFASIGSIHAGAARTPNKHVTFGYGPHFCIGAFLGRVHVSAILGGLRDLVGGIRLTAPAQRLHSNFVYGYHTVPVSFVPEL